VSFFDFDAAGVAARAVKANPNPIPAMTKYKARRMTLLNRAAPCVQIKDGLGWAAHNHHIAVIQQPESLAANGAEVALNQDRFFAPGVIAVDIDLRLVGGELIAL